MVDQLEQSDPLWTFFNSIDFTARHQIRSDVDTVWNFHITLFGEKGPTGRTPTFAVDVDRVSSLDVSVRLGSEGIFVWSGDYHAYEVMERLGKPSGLVRIGFVHYNTLDEVDRVLGALDAFA